MIETRQKRKLQQQAFDESNYGDKRRVKARISGKNSLSRQRGRNNDIDITSDDPIQINNNINDPSNNIINILEKETFMLTNSISPVSITLNEVPTSSAESNLSRQDQVITSAQAGRRNELNNANVLHEMVSLPPPSAFAFPSEATKSPLIQTTKLTKDHGTNSTDETKTSQKLSSPIYATLKDNVKYQSQTYLENQHQHHFQTNSSTSISDYKFRSQPKRTLLQFFLLFLAASISCTLFFVLCLKALYQERQFQEISFLLAVYDRETQYMQKKLTQSEHENQNYQYLLTDNNEQLLQLQQINTALSQKVHQLDMDNDGWKSKHETTSIDLRTTQSRLHLLLQQILYPPSSSSSYSSTESNEYEFYSHQENTYENNQYNRDLAKTLSAVWERMDQLIHTTRQTQQQHTKTLRQIQALIQTNQTLTQNLTLAQQTILELNRQHQNLTKNCVLTMSQHNDDFVRQISTSNQTIHQLQVKLTQTQQDLFESEFQIMNLFDTLSSQDKQMQELVSDNQLLQLHLHHYQEKLDWQAEEAIAAVDAVASMSHYVKMQQIHDYTHQMNLMWDSQMEEAIGAINMVASTVNSVKREQSQLHQHEMESQVEEAVHAMNAIAMAANDKKKEEINQLKDRVGALVNDAFMKVHSVGWVMFQYLHHGYASTYMEDTDTDIIIDTIIDTDDDDHGELEANFKELM